MSTPTTTTQKLIAEQIDPVTASFLAILMTQFKCVPDEEAAGFTYPFFGYLYKSQVADFLSYTHRKDVPEAVKPDLAKNVLGRYIAAAYETGEYIPPAAALSSVTIGDVSVSYGDGGIEGAIKSFCDGYSNAGRDTWRTFRQLKF